MKSFGELIGVLELIIELIIKTCNEVGEDKWLWIVTEILLQVELREGFGHKFGTDTLVCGKVIGIDESITIDSFGLMNPKLYKVIWLLDGFSLGSQKTLENIGQMSDCELIMEVLGGLSEVSDNFIME